MKKNIDITNELTEISPLVAGIDPLPTIEVPSVYFTDLSDRIISKLKNNNESSINSNLLEKAGKANLYAVPNGYFDQLFENVLHKIKTEKPSARILSMPVLKWAVAACVVGLIGYSVYNRYFFSSKEMDTNKEWNKSYALSKLIIQKNDFDATLNQLDDNTIISFLQENGHDVNAALLASLTETDKIDIVNEYFCDDENLNSMMNDLNIAEKQ